ncbi:sigma factor-like helix-turn-helix DNA-binding protein, partial [Kitasatospora sp. NPDC059571]|uniref:sigma factor-like helix-turn-helix DNA-binding protein n=1 Tax=Kitasatospora sp. NPDC059571 TaxID=3346871 RepID=UPI0036D1DBB3
MPPRPPHPGQAPAAAPDGHPVGDAEEVLVANYRRLTRIAYLVLPAGADRHRRLLTAHAVTQRALPGLNELRSGCTGTADEVYDALRLRVVRRALAGSRRLRRPLPGVWGLRLFTADGGEEELALDRALAALPAPARAAYALRAVDGLPPTEIADLLVRAGVTRPAEARRAAEHLATTAGEPARFDPCTVRVQPGDLIRRRRAGRLGAAAVALGGFF